MTVYGEPEKMDREEALAITKETIFVKEYEYKKLASKPDLLTAYKYLYWACYRGHIHVANFLLHKCRISPFIINTETSLSPFMAAIEGNQYLMCRLLLNKDFKIQEKPKLIETQRNACDRYGNNPLHKAFKFRNDKLVRLLLVKNVGDLLARNHAGRLPLEIPHNSILSDPKVKKAVSESVPNDLIAKHDAIVMKKEPDYMFVVNTARKEVLTDQLKAINKKYTDDTKLDPDDPDYGLLDENEVAIDEESFKEPQPMRFLSYNEYPQSGEEKKSEDQKSTLILVHFSDRILNKKAEDIKMKVHLQDKF